MNLTTSCGLQHNVLRVIWYWFVLATSPSGQCYSETLSTLRYAQQAKCIVNKPVINEVCVTVSCLLKHSAVKSCR